MGVSRGGTPYNIMTYTGRDFTSFLRFIHISIKTVYLQQIKEMQSSKVWQYLLLTFVTFYRRAKMSANSVLVSVGLYNSALQGNKQTTVTQNVSGFQNPGNFLFWNLESSALESWIQLNESGIPLKIGIQNPGSTDREWNPESKSDLDSPYKGRICTRSISPEGLVAG